MIHTHSTQNCGEERCDDGLAFSLCKYIPFLVALCPGLEKLIIRAKEDEAPKANPHPPNNGMPSTREYILLPIFENQLLTITSLERLEVCGKYA